DGGGGARDLRGRARRAARGRRRGDGAAAGRARRAPRAARRVPGADAAVHRGRGLIVATPTTAVDDLLAEEALGEEYLVRVLTSLVQTQSGNPGIFESAMTQRVSQWFEDTPAEVHLVESLPGRHSVAAVLRGSGGG